MRINQILTEKKQKIIRIMEKENLYNCGYENLDILHIENNFVVFDMSMLSPNNAKYCSVLSCIKTNNAKPILFSIRDVINIKQTEDGNGEKISLLEEVIKIDSTLNSAFNYNSALKFYKKINKNVL